MANNISDIFNRHRKKAREEDLYKWHKVAYSKNDTYWLTKMLKISPKQSNTSGGHGGGWGFGVHNEKHQRVMLKMSYSNSMQAHQKYIGTYMPQEQKESVIEKPLLFGNDNSTYEAAMSANHFKFIISPENQNVDLETLSNEFIKRIEKLTNYKLLWQGAIHKDTAHHHVHICINGIDKTGQRVRFPKEMVKRTMREIASYVTTQLIGERTEMEMEAARLGMTVAMRWTTIDKQIEAGDWSLIGHGSEIDTRLAFLESIGLAEKRGEQLMPKEGWKDVLVATGRYNTFLSEWQKRNGNLEMYTGGGVYGKVTRVITFDRDESWNDALIVATKEGHNIYVPVWQLKKENILGKTVEIKSGNRAMSRQTSDRDIHIVVERDQDFSSRKNTNSQDR